MAAQLSDSFASGLAKKGYIMKFKTLARKGCAVFLALALCMSLVQVPAFAAELEGGETPSVSEPAAPEANETTSPVDKAPADNGEASAPEAPKQDATEEKEETTPVETPEEETNEETKQEPTETETPEADAEEGTAQEETNEETNSEEPNDEDATDNETPEEDAEAEDAEEETPEDTTEEDATDSETPEEEAEEDADKEESTDEEEVLDEEPTEEVTYSEAAQKFLDAVAGLPDSVTKENFESISALLDKVQALFGALTEEEMALVDPVLVKVSNLMESLDDVGALLEEEELSGEVEVKTYAEFVAAVEAPAVTAITLVTDIASTFSPLTIDLANRQSNLTLNLGNYELGSKDNGPAITIQDTVGKTPFAVVLNGGTIKGGVKVSSGIFTMESGKITESANSGVVVEAGATFNMKGGEISGNTASGTSYVDTITGYVNEKNHQAGGGVLVKGGTFNMSGGLITNNSTEDTSTRYSVTGNAKGQGGGVAVVNDGYNANEKGSVGTFNLTGGTISNNTAGEGGGVFIGDKAEFTMHGNGLVDNNTAQVGEGGGIYIKGTGTITAGSITNNTTNTEEDLGGGGIYVENSGELNLQNALITDNEAAGFGGGIAACVHGKTVMFSVNGAAIFDNDASGTGQTKTNTKVDGQDAWKMHTDKNLAEGAKDIFSAGNSEVAGTPGALVGLVMLGGELANWEGWKINYTTKTGGHWTENGKPDTSRPISYEKVEQGQTAAIYGDQLLGLTADPSEKAKALATQFACVLITGNKSTKTHGGGVANNGILTIGAGDTENNESVSTDLNLDKTLDVLPGLDAGEDKRELGDQEFTFEVKTEEGESVGTVKNDKDGKATFNISAKTFEKAENGETFTFFVSEPKGNDTTVTYDPTVYKVTVTIKVDKTTATIGNNNNYTFTSRLIDTVVVEKITYDEDGNVVDTKVVEDNLIRFENFYTPEKPEVPEVPEKPPVDPVDPPEKPPVDPPEKPEKPEEKPEEKPPVDVPDEEPPLVEIPEEPPVDIPDEEPPLVEIPDEQPPLVEIPEPDVPRAPATPVVEVPDPEVPLVDIPEEDVPLADVPATGDNSGLWMVLGLVACAGLAYFFLDEKKRQNEAK